MWLNQLPIIFDFNLNGKIYEMVNKACSTQEKLGILILGHLDNVCF